MEPTSPSPNNVPLPSTPTPPGPPEPPRPPEPVPDPELPPVQETRTIYTPAPAVTPPVGGTAAAYVGASHRQRYVIGTIVLLTVGAGASTFFLMQRGGDPADLKTALPVEQATPTSTPTPTPTAEPTPEIVLNKGDWKFVILNGSGVAGAAAEAKPKLEELGYTVVQVGNADTQDYTETKLFVSDLTDPAVQLLLDDLQTMFPAITVSDETLEESDTVTARVILGAEE